MPKERDDISILMDARDFVACGWTRGALARDGAGQEISFKPLKKAGLFGKSSTVRAQEVRERAVSYCIVGAIRVARQDFTDGKPAASQQYRLCETLLDQACRDYPNDKPYYSISSWNDRHGRTKEEVLTLMDKVIHRMRVGT